MSTPETPIHLPRFVKAYRDRHGKVRCYYRRRGFPVVPLHGEPGSDAFAASYELAAARGIPRVRRKLPPGFVYVIRVRGFDLAKIGYSRAPDKRISELARGAGMIGGLEELARFPATATHERAMHKRFAKQRLFGEWFRLSGPVADWIDAAQAAEAA